MAEVDWDDEENESPYVKVDRYKKKAVQINKAIRKLQNESLSIARILEEKLKVKDDEIKKEWIILSHNLWHISLHHSGRVETGETAS